MQTRFDPYLNMDKGWDDSTEELVTELLKLAGDASRTLTEMHYRIAILQSKVRPETFIKVINAIPLPNTDMTVILRAEPELGTYSAKQASKDVLYMKLKRVITGVWQHRGSYYERQH